MSCISETARIPVRASYVNLYKWPESDADFVKSSGGGTPAQSPAIESISCRQMYLRSYTFSRKETISQITVKRFVKVREKVAAGKKKTRRRWRVAVKELSCAVFRRLLFCSAAVDVV